MSPTIKMKKAATIVRKANGTFALVVDEYEIDGLLATQHSSDKSGGLTTLTFDASALFYKSEHPSIEPKDVQ